MHCTSLVHLISWATAVQAFFPFIPDYACSKYRGCEASVKRDVPAGGATDQIVKDSDPGELLTFKLSQRSSLKHEAPPVIAARQAERLRRKYGGFVGFVSTTLDSKDPGTKRDNSFTVDTATTPTEPNSVGIDQDGSDVSYFVEATVGSSGKALYLLCDTGAGSTWVMGEDCDSTACESHTTWGPSESTTDATTGETFSIQYGTGSVKGSLVEDSISFGSVKVTMTFGTANETSSDFDHFAFDGILGLSMANGSTGNFFQTIKADNVLTSNVFSVDLNRAEDGTNNGQLTIGGIDSDKYTGAITYTSVNSSAGGDWAIHMDNMGYDGKKAGVTDRLAYIDTGTTYAFGPSDDVAALHKLIPGANSSDGTTYTAPCDSDQPLTITFSGVDYNVSAKDWLSDASSDGTCTSNFYGREVVSGAWLLGDVYLKNVYTVFDADQSRVGFALKANKTSTSTSSSSNSSSTTSASGSTSAAVESNGASQAASASAGGRLEFEQFSLLLCVAAVVAMMAY